MKILIPLILLMTLAQTKLMAAPEDRGVEDRDNQAYIYQEKAIQNEEVFGKMETIKDVEPTLHEKISKTSLQNFSMNL